MPDSTTDQVRSMATAPEDKETDVTAMVALSNGDEGGTMGVASGMLMGPGRCMLGSQVVFVAGQPTWGLTATAPQNLSNVPGLTAVPSQTVKQVLR